VLTPPPAQSAAGSLAAALAGACQSANVADIG
jgi:hypothetical protein